MRGEFQWQKNQAEMNKYKYQDSAVEAHITVILFYLFDGKKITVAQYCNYFVFCPTAMFS